MLWPAAIYLFEVNNAECDKNLFRSYADVPSPISWRTANVLDNLIMSTPVIY